MAGVLQSPSPFMSPVFIQPIHAHLCYLPLFHTYFPHTSTYIDQSLALPVLPALPWHLICRSYRKRSRSRSPRRRSRSAERNRSKRRSRSRERRRSRSRERRRERHLSPVRRRSRSRSRDRRLAVALVLHAGSLLFWWSGLKLQAI